MILQSLDKLYDRIKNEPEYNVSEPGYSLQKIAFAVVLNPDGSLFQIEDIRTLNGKKMEPRQLQVLGANKPSGSGLNASFLWDTVGYLLGYKPEPATEKELKREADSFNAFRELHLACEKEVNDPAFSAVCRFLEKWEPREAANYPFLAEATGYGVFRIKAEPGYVHERPAIVDYFKRTRMKTADQNAVTGQCLISGQTVPIARLQALIKGIGAKPAALVGFNDKAYESYGKEQAFNAPVGEEQAFRYTVALNALTDGPMKRHHCISMGDLKVIFWAGKKSLAEDFVGGFFDTRHDSGDDSTRKKIALLFECFREGRIPDRMPDFDPDVPFYVLGLSVNVTRCVVRFFYTSTVGVLFEHFSRHFRDMALERRFETDSEFPTVRQILDQTCVLKGSFPDRDSIPKNLPGTLFDSILRGIDYPAGVYNRILQRIKHDQYQDYIKVSFLKAFLIRNHNKEYSMSLDKNIADPPYLCGRLLAVLDKTQRDALGDTNTNIRESFYAAASSRPGVVFPRLLRLYSHHLGKLPTGARIARDSLMQEIIDKLGHTYPMNLNLVDQGTFSIGYYQQMQAFFQKADKKETGSEDENTKEETK